MKEIDCNIFTHSAQITYTYIVTLILIFEHYVSKSEWIIL